MGIEFNCIECHNCEDNCSIFLATGKYSALEKLKVIELLKNRVGLNDEQISTIFNCTKCEACQEICPEEIPLIKLFDWARHEIKEKYGLRNDKQKYLIKNILETGNPFGHQGFRLDNLNQNILKQKMDYECLPIKSKTLLHLGCMLGYRLQSIRDDVINILDLLGIEFTLLRDENCCGYFIWNTGDHDSAHDVIKKNSRIFEQFDTIICACAGCYTYFKEYYPENQKFHHIIEIIDQEFKKMKNYEPFEEESILINTNKSIVFHDSCHLTRPHRIIEQPRNILRILGYKINELPNSKENCLCCGADGGMRIINPELAIEIGKTRIEEVIAQGMNKLITLCPFCIFNFKEASSEKEGFEIHVLYKDIRIFLEKRLNNNIIN